MSEQENQSTIQASAEQASTEQVSVEQTPTEQNEQVNEQTPTEQNEQVNESSTKQNEQVLNEQNEQVSNEQVLNEQSEKAPRGCFDDYFVEIPPDINNIHVDKLYVLVSKYGYSGAFLEREHAEIMMTKYPDTAFIIREFPQIHNIKDQKVYVVVDKNDMPYYVGDKNNASVYHKELLTIENTYNAFPDDLCRPIGFEELVEFRMGVHESLHRPKPRMLSVEEIAERMRAKMEIDAKAKNKCATSVGVDACAGTSTDVCADEDNVRLDHNVLNVENSAIGNINC